MALVLCTTLTVVAEVGVTDKEIKIGMVNAQSGPSASLGLELKKGSMLYIDKINKEGTINTKAK